MKPINTTRLLAQSYLGWRKSAPRLASLLPKYLLLWALLVAALLAITGIAWLLRGRVDVQLFVALAAGLVFGAILRDIAWARRFVLSWPLLERLLDWQAVEREASGPAEHPESSPRSRRPLVLALLGLFVLLGALLMADRVAMRVYDPRPGNAAGQVIIYTTDWCPYCEALRVQLRRSSIPYTELDVEKSIGAHYGHRALGGRGIPVTVVGERVIHGLDREALDAALRAAGHTPAPWDLPGAPP